MIYLDNAATTKVSEDVINEMVHYFTTEYANPSSEHIFGKKIKKVIFVKNRVINYLISN